MNAQTGNIQKLSHQRRGMIPYVEGCRPSFSRRLNADTHVASTYRCITPSRRYFCQRSKVIREGQGARCSYGTYSNNLTFASFPHLAIRFTIISWNIQFLLCKKCHLPMSLIVTDSLQKNKKSIARQILTNIVLISQFY